MKKGNTMRKLVVTEFLSLDGVMENPMWTFPYWNDQTEKFKSDEADASDALLLGRVTYEGFAAVWTERKEDGAEYFNGIRKYVVSTTLDGAAWNNSVLIKDNIVEEITRLKQQDGKNIVVHGSGRLIQTLIRHDLIDEYRLLVYPLVLGTGQRLFEDENRVNLKLVDSVITGFGVVGLVYEPDRK
jgi:dihydrofolate reductase